jgi:hypothetical protein
MEKMRSCSCDGSNENCVYCYGRGFVTVPEGPPLGVSEQNCPRSAVHAASSPVMRCPNCEFKGTALDLARHFPKRHPPSKAWHSGRPIKDRRNDTRLITCVTCGVPVRCDHAERHNRKTHQSGLIKDVGVSSPEGESVLTPQGGSSKRRIMPQWASKNKSRIREQKPTQNGKANGLDKWKQSIQASQSPIQPNLDATRLYAHAYREHGKFGSHSSHDGFDDESGA